MLLRGVMGGGTGSTFALDRESAGKTGTTDESAAVWFVGYTPELAAAVWVGDPRGGNKYPLREIEINGEYYSQVYGASLPGPIWRAAMTGALRDAPKTSFQLKPRWKLGDAGIGPTKPVKKVIEVLPVDPSAPIDPNAPVDPNAPGAPVVPPVTPVPSVPGAPATPSPAQP
jgi:membrane peptidoglycan carboxypeptidase